MSAASGVSSVAGSPLPKWQLALAVGAPVALGLGYMYYKKSSKPAAKPARGKPKSSLENGTSGEKQISIDGECAQKNGSSATPAYETPYEMAQRLKCEGNACFKMGKFDEAIARYNNAIEACPKENIEDLAIFYQNRAASYEQLRKYSAVKGDCTKALELKPKYSKALIRRARALEHCNELESALEDVTSACILESFANQPALVMADRVLKQLGRQHAQEHLAKKKLIMPSKYFVKSYIGSFHNDPVSRRLRDTPDDTISTNYAKVLQCLAEQKYDDIVPLCTEEIQRLEADGTSQKMEVLLLRATFHLLLGNHDTAIEDFGTIISSDTASKETKVNALIKRATLHMQLENPEKSFCDFEKAAELYPDCTDIYHHRGQVNLLLERIDDAKADFERAVELNPNYGVAYVQKCYADHRYAVYKRDMQLIDASLQGFEQAFKKFPDCPEGYVLYAQVLSESQNYEKADNFFAQAIEKDPNNATVYVHRGLLQLQWNGNVDKAIENIKQALNLDDKCEFGYETLGTIEVQRGNLKEAIELFDKALALGRTSMELTHIFSLRDAAKAQLTVKDRLGGDALWSLQNMS